MNLTVINEGIKDDLGFKRLWEPKEVVQSWVFRELRHLDNKAYYQINNLIIKDEFKKWVKIDRIIVSDFGVFVIYLKRKQGLVYGYDENTCWTNNCNGHISRFPNPIYENQRRINALKKILIEYPHIHYHSIIAFTKKTEFYIEAKVDVGLCHLNDITSKIQKVNEVNISSKDKDSILKKIRRERVMRKVEKQKAIEMLIDKNRKRMLRDIIQRSVKNREL